MSFTSEVKKEIIEKRYSKIENDVILSSYIRNTKEQSNERIEIITENIEVLSYILEILKLEYDITNTIEKLYQTNFKHDVYRLVIDENLEEINSNLIIDKDIVDDYFIDSDDLKAAYLKGAFLATGSINDPKKSRYHLEFLTENVKEANFIEKILNYFYLNAKSIKREKGYMVYVKEAEKIGDFLRLIGTNRAIMYYEDIRIYRDHINMTNRLNNCEQANVDKIISSANKQIEDIDLILDKLGMDFLDEKLQEVVIYRKKYPDVSLEELSNIITIETSKPITKSGLNHRLRKLKEIASKIK